MIELAHLQVLAAALFSIGLYGVLARRSAVLILVLPAHIQQQIQFHTIAVALILAQLVLVAHLDRVEVADVYADAAKNTPAKIYLECLDNLATTTLVFCEFGIVRHLCAHALRRTGTDAYHTPGAVRLGDITVPQEGREAHISLGYLVPFVGVGILECHRLAKRCLQRYVEPLQETYHRFFNCAATPATLTRKYTALRPSKMRCNRRSLSDFSFICSPNCQATGWSPQLLSNFLTAQAARGDDVHRVAPHVRSRVFEDDIDRATQ